VSRGRLVKEFNAQLNIKIRQCNLTVELLTRCVNLIKPENGLDPTKQSLDISKKTAVICMKQLQEANELDLQCNFKTKKDNKCHSSIKTLSGTYHCIYIHTIIPQSLYNSLASPAADKFKDPHDPQQAKSKWRHKLKGRQGPPQTHVSNSITAGQAQYTCTGIIRYHTLLYLPCWAG
jgi:hypothetical protein